MFHPAFPLRASDTQISDCTGYSPSSPRLSSSRYFGTDRTTREFDARTSTCRFAQRLSLFMRLSLLDFYKLVFLKGIKDILVATRIGKRDVIHGVITLS